MPHDDAWLTTLLRRWPSLSAVVRGQVQVYMSLSPKDRKNQRRLEKKLKGAACALETFHQDAVERKARLEREA